MSSSSAQSVFSLRHIIGDCLLTLFAALITAVSFSVKDPMPYLFPRLLAAGMLLLCLLQLISVYRRRNQTAAAPPMISASGKSARMIALIIIYVAAAETIGFYVSALVAFFTVALIGGEVYDKRRIIITAIAALGTVCVLYLLFSVLLKVQTPRGWLL